MKQRILSALLAIVMVVSILPVSAFATASHAHGNITYDTEWSGSMAATTISQNTNIVLTDDTTFTGRLTISTGVTVNLCLNGNALTLGANYIMNNGTLNVCDCSTGGTISSTNRGIHNNSGNVTVSGGTISGEKYGIWNQGGTVKISNGTVHGTTDDGIVNNGSGIVEVSGGSVTGGKYGINNNVGTVTVSGGSVTSDNYGIWNKNKSTVTVSSGSVSGTKYGIYNDGSTVTVSGGSVSSDTTGIYNTTKYSDPSDVQGTVTVSGGTVSGTKHGIYNYNSIVTVSGGSVTGNGSNGYGIDVRGGTVTVSNGTVSGNYYGIYNNKGSVTVSGGTVSVSDNGQNAICNCTEASVVKISGGTITAQTYNAVISNVGTLYLSNAPTINKGRYNNHISFTSSGVIYATATEDADSDPYTDASLYMFGSGTLSDGRVVVYNANLTDGKFILQNSGYYLVQEGNNLVLKASTPLAAPANLRWDGTTARWDAVANAEGYSYQLYKDGEAYGGRRWRYETSNTFTITESGRYHFTVIARGSGSHINSPAATSEPIDVYTVTFDGNGQTISVSPAIVIGGNTVSTPTAPKAEGFTFGGWYTDKECTDANAYDFTEAVTGDITLYAKWTKSHIHVWSTAWTSDGTYHWRECTADDCDVTQNSQKNGYGAHTPEDDDGNCLTAVECSKCKRELTPAATAHSFTNKASQTIASAADCQNIAKYYVQCDNCNVVSDTLTVEVGELGEHNWDPEWSKDGDNHWHKCLVVDCTEIKNEKGHFSTDDNVATYTKKPICDECGREYGDVVPDDVNPTGTITVYGNTWSEFINTITFGIFCKDTQTVEITTSDVGLGVSKAEYIFTETVYADADAVLNDTGISWNALTLDADGNTNFNIVPNDKGIVYLKITDKAGNVTVIRSDKVTVDNIAPVIAGIENGKTYCGPVEVTVRDEYFAKVTVNGAEVAVTDNKFTVTPAEGRQTIKAIDKAGNETVVEITVNDGHELLYSASGNELHESCFDCDHVAKAFIGIVGMDKNNISKVYDGQAVAYEISYEGNFLGKDKLTVAFEDSNGAALAAAPVDAGQYSVQLGINGTPWPATYTFYILPKSVALPEINSKVYTGEILTADIQDTELYTVTENDGGTDVGWYDVTLTLKDAVNYQWAGSGETSVTVKFEITKAINEWLGEPYIMGWRYGEAANAPVATAKFGTMEYTFYDAEGNELTGVPVDAGDYTVKVVVPATDNYTVISKKLPFTIGKRLVSVKWTEPDSLVYDGTSKTPYAEYAGDPTDDDAPQIIIVLTQGCNNIDVGTFTFTATGVADSNYELTGDLVSPEYTITARPLQQSDFTAAIDRLVYNGSAITPAVESTTALVTAEDYTVAYESNVNAGENTAKIIITGKRNATGSVEILFSIAKADYPVVWLQNLAGNHGEPLSTVLLPEGFVWDDPDEVIKYGSGHEYAATYTPEDTANYNVAHGFITVNGADVTAPTGTITIGENSWNKFWNNVTFGLFFKDTQTVMVTAEDAESGVTATEYYLAADEASNFADVEWTAFEGSFDINPNNKYVVYIRITNGAGYKTVINSDGVVLDSIAPVISGIENGKDVYGDATFTVDEDHLASVTVDGNNADAVDGKYTIAADNAEHTVVVTDHSGNSTEYKLTVYKTYTVTFLADGKEIESQVVGHGKDAKLPEIPAKDGYTAKWNADGKNITTDTIITAEYTAIPETDSPQTGDHSNMVLWLTMLLVSSMGIVTTTVYDRKKRNQA